METTRHVTATVYLVNGGEVALHEHRRHGILIPPGGHVERDEFPHRAGLREVREETGIEPNLLDETKELEASTVETLPRPRQTLLYDINVHEGSVGHQHIDPSYYAEAATDEFDPADGEAPAESWGWYTAEDLRSGDFLPDVVSLGIDAIRAADEG